MVETVVVPALRLEFLQESLDQRVLLVCREKPRAMEGYPRTKLLQIRDELVTVTLQPGYSAAF